MSLRHNYAIAAVQCYDLLELCKYLAGSVQNALQEGQMPHMDPAIQIITHQIAFAGNGDAQLFVHYTKLFDYCMAMADQTVLEKPKQPDPIILS